ncbi:MAG: HAD family phosphatase [Actinobacteria bacterium]|nr:HAD family phosphatase [Actinomycetota bacterium]
MKNHISLIIFDMDGLMFDTERLAIPSWKKAGEKYGYNIEPAHIIKTIGVYIEDAREIFKKHFGKDFPFNEIRKLRERYAFEYMEENGIPVKKGLHKLIDYLEDKKILKAVATSSERKKVDRYLTLANMEDRFDYMVCGDEVIKGKPDPEIFLKVARNAGCEPDKCIVLEDSENGIIAASRAGMKPIFIPDIQRLSGSTERLIFKEFSSLFEVKDYIKSVLEKIKRERK